LATTLEIKVNVITSLLTAVSVADTVKTSQIGRGLCGRDDVVNRDGQLGAGEGNLHNLTALATIPLYGLFDVFAYCRGNPFAKVLFGHTQFPRSLVFIDSLAVIRDINL